MGYMGFGMQKWIYSQKAKKAFSRNRFLSGTKTDSFDFKNDDLHIGGRSPNPKDRYPDNLLDLLTKKRSFGQKSVNQILLFAITAILLFAAFQIRKIISPGSNEASYSNERLAAFNLSIDYGYEHLARKEFYHALAEFDHAKKLYPDETAAIKGLADTYGSFCSNQRLYCDSALKYTEALSMRFPNDTSLQSKVQKLRKLKLPSKN